MEKSIVVLGPLSLVLFFLVSCGSSAPPPKPDLSESFVSKSILLTPNWPEELKANSSQLEIDAYLKGKDTQGKGLGSLGPISAKSGGSEYRFVFENLSSEVDPEANGRFEILWPSGSLSRECRLVATIVKSISLVSEENQVSAAEEEFDLSPDCDGDRLTNLSEFSLGLKVDSADSDSDGVADAEDLFPLDVAEAFDQDEDGVGDNGDNCAAIGNGSQADLDSDGLGDDCDPDSDNDGILNEVELGLGLDPLQTDSDGDSVSDGQDNCYLQANSDQSNLDNDQLGDVCDLDRDGDLVFNVDDNCADAANADQTNGDGDPFGDVCDCDPIDGRRFVTALDEPDAQNFDSNCDGIDGTIVNALFVSQTDGNDSQAGTVAAPFKTLAKAYPEAITQNKDVYVEAGLYDLSGLTFAKTVRLFGGYQNGAEGQPFGLRCVYPSVCSESVLSLAETTATLLLTSAAGKVAFSGFRFGTPVKVQNSSITFQNNRFATLTLEGQSPITLENNLIAGDANPEISRGILINGTDNVTLAHNVIRAGLGRLSTSIEIIGASPTLDRNTIDAVNRYVPASGISTSRTTMAIVLEHALGVNLTDNVFITGAAENQYVLYCRGLEPVSPSLITANLFAAFPLSGSAADLIPRSVSCLGEFDFLAGDGLDLGFQSAAGNFDYPADRDYDDLIDLNNDRIIDSDYSQLGALR